MVAVLLALAIGGGSVRHVLPQKIVTTYHLKSEALSMLSHIVLNVHPCRWLPQPVKCQFPMDCVAPLPSRPPCNLPVISR